MVGVVLLAVQVVRGDTGTGIAMFLILCGYAAALAVFARRNEAVSLLRGDTPDERAALIQLRASAVTGNVMAVVLAVGFVVSLSRGASDVGTWTLLGAICGATFIVATVVVGRRS